MEQKNFLATIANQNLRGREDICAELKLARREHIVNAKRRQQLLDNNQELRNLIFQLRNANVSRQLTEQIESSDRAKEDARRQKHEDDLKFREEVMKNLEIKQEKELNEIKKSLDYRENLLEQINQRMDLKKKEKHQELVKDLDYVKKLSAQIEEEKNDELRKAKIYRIQFHNDMLENRRLQEEHKQRELSKEIDEVEKAVSVAKEHDRIFMEATQKKRDELNRKQQISEKIGLEVLKRENDRRQRQELLDDLLVEEHMAKDDIRYRKQLENKIKERMQWREEVLHLSNKCRDRKEELKKEEKKFLEMQTKYMNDYDKNVAEVEQKRRQFKEKYKNGLLELVDMKRQERRDATLAELRDLKIRAEAELKLQQEVDDERTRLLMNAPTENLRFLPRGVLRKSDEQFLNIKLS